MLYRVSNAGDKIPETLDGFKLESQKQTKAMGHGATNKAEKLQWKIKQTRTQAHVKASRDTWQKKSRNASL